MPSVIRSPVGPRAFLRGTAESEATQLDLDAPHRNADPRANTAVFWRLGLLRQRLAPATRLSWPPGGSA